MADDGESLESWLNKATNPSNRQEDWEYIMGFCDQINKELEGPQISVRLLAHKIQSPQEWEAIQALMYLGDKVSERVKTKVIEMLYSWTMSLPDEAKIFEAYEMLKSQGIVLVDPEIPLDATLIPSPSPRPKNPVFDDEKKSKRLAELLKSKKPEDLEEANRLIKNMVKEDEVRTQKATKQKSTLEAVNNSVKLLNEMLAHFSQDDSTDGDKEIIRELYGDCDKLRQTVVQLATETEDNDSSLGDILQASDDLSHVINSYKKIVEGQIVNGGTEAAQQTQSSVRQGRTNQSEILIDLVGLDIQSVSLPGQQPPTSSLSIPADLLCGSTVTDPQSHSPSVPSAALSLLDEELLSLGNMQCNSSSFICFSWKHLRTSCLHVHILETCDSLCNYQHFPFVCFILGKVCPVTAYDKNGVRVLLHFATDCPAGRPDVLVMVASMLNTAPLPVRNIALQAAVPKTMKVRLQSPSGSELAPFNPILPPAAITQVMLLANPLKEKVRMRYKLTFTLGEQPHSEVGEVNEFPPTDRWGAL
uniref:Golgi associated, gamma adaptin ear containing, ARF binding protein 3a n=1 Tax=Sander lucioperca TaxID=283035 RepID=A0A8D0AZM9_SANLU